MRIPKRRKHDSRNYCMDSNQILLNDKGQQVHRMLRTGGKSAICYCLEVDSVIIPFSLLFLLCITATLPIYRSIFFHFFPKL